MGDIFSNACAYGNWTVDILPFGELEDHLILLCGRHRHHDNGLII